MKRESYLELIEGYYSGTLDPEKVKKAELTEDELIKFIVTASRQSHEQISALFSELNNVRANYSQMCRYMMKSSKMLKNFTAVNDLGDEIEQVCMEMEK